jgi:hypothetical protein
MANVKAPAQECIHGFGIAGSLGRWDLSARSVFVLDRGAAVCLGVLRASECVWPTPVKGGSSTYQRTAHCLELVLDPFVEVLSLPPALWPCM